MTSFLSGESALGWSASSRTYFHSHGLLRKSHFIVFLKLNYMLWSWVILCPCLYARGEDGYINRKTWWIYSTVDHNLILGLLLRSVQEGGERSWRLFFLLRCACGPKWKPIKERFMFIKCLSKLKNFLINSNLVEAPQWLGVSPPQYRLFACYNSRLEIRWWLH